MNHTMIAMMMMVLVVVVKGAENKEVARTCGQDSHETH
jgi:hypothetical protein